MNKALKDNLTIEEFIQYMDYIDFSSSDISEAIEIMEEHGYHKGFEEAIKSGGDEDHLFDENALYHSGYLEDEKSI